MEKVLSCIPRVPIDVNKDEADPFKQLRKWDPTEELEDAQDGDDGGDGVSIFYFIGNSSASLPPTITIRRPSGDT